MNKPRGVAGGREAAGATNVPVTAATRDLVGWARQSPLHDARPLSADVARRVLATALDLDEAALSALSTADLRTALARIRSLVAYCDHLASEAMVDDLTGAMRRGSGMAGLQRELDRARRVRDHGIIVMFLDVDGLKHINDTEGHAAGDELLRAVVAAIRDRIRSYDLVFRYGGDEFVCVLVGATRKQAEQTLGEIRAKLAKRTRGRTFSAGIAEAKAEDTADAVVARADAALYAERAEAVAAV